jgi:carboxymethylenebutenolidase
MNRRPRGGDNIRVKTATEEDPMTQRDVSIQTPDGTMDASFHTPAGAGPWPAVIMYPDAGGLRPTFDQMGQQLADLGYAVLVPNFYYRLGEIAPFDMKNVFSDEAERNRLMKLVGSVSKAEATVDARALLDWLAAQSEVADTKVGTTGYCMGGGLALNAAGRFPDRVGAAASFHGGQIASTAPDSPHLLAGEMQAKVYVAGAEKDGSFDDEAFERMSKALTEAGLDHTLVTYPALHGFAVPDNPTYDEAAATRHWEALEDLYGSALTPA